MTSATGAEPLVHLDGICKSFRRGSLLSPPWRTHVRTEVLRGVDLAAERGQHVALLGANGAGKTTILKIVAGLLHADAGTAQVAGLDAARQPRLVARQAALVLADERSFHWRLTVDQNMEFFGALTGVTGARFRERLDHLCRRLDLDQYRRNPFGTLSTGTRQRLTVARALLGRPRILLLDEPTRSVDVAHASDLWRVVGEEMAAVDGCLLLVTHNMQEAMSLSTRIVILDNGRVVLDAGAQRLQAAATAVDGFTLNVRGLTAAGLAALSHFPGVDRVEVVSRSGDEQTIELVAEERALAGILGALTAGAATITSLQRAAPLHGLLARLVAPDSERVSA